MIGDPSYKLLGHGAFGCVVDGQDVVEAVNGNVAVLGTAPALGGGTTLIKDGAIAYAASRAEAGRRDCTSR